MFTDWENWQRAALTLIIILAAWLVRQIGIRRVRESARILEVGQRRVMSALHHGAVITIVLTVLILWLPQLQRFALSITAIAVALVVATKELLLCLLGSLLIRTSRAFVIGDWIQVQDRFGEVIERNLLSTTIQEVETHGYTSTGRTITLPNSLFIAVPTANQNFLRRYQFHSFALTIEPDAFPFDAEQRLEARLLALTAPFADTARRYNAMLELRTGIDIPDPDPAIDFSTNDIAKLVTTITVFCPTSAIVTLEKAMTREFFEWYRANRGAAGVTADSGAPQSSTP